MLKYKDKLILYTHDCGLFELDLGTPTTLPPSATEPQMSLTLFPNPAQDILQFETDLVVHSVEIVDLTGRIHQKTTLFDNERQIDLSHLKSGVYFAVFHAKGLSITKKIVVVK